MNRYQKWYQANKERRRYEMRIYYHLNKITINEKRRKRKRKTKGQKEFREKRAKCVYYLIRVKKRSYRYVAERLSIYDGKDVWSILKRYERKLENGSQERNCKSS